VFKIGQVKTGSWTHRDNPTMQSLKSLFRKTFDESLNLWTTFSIVVVELSGIRTWW